ncbi:hypothetical protein [Dorea formicigenerans]|uniref:BIG2 domain-containing protein n=1 Tax=Dorea formicigenerans TaxID=39486 RepID=A0A413W3X0_9FIRM|nr:hypothetical protein [Dorea formicigenerans]RGT12131.1 hypothetical protein DWX53_00805 [Dorea formicigenerans]RHB40576.1 hypothetical protein DW885_05755 [Dorea formicigenerans]RHE28540.1 hypothetical protein DW756_05785 [Dorea formicigenerans]
MKRKWTLLFMTMAIMLCIMGCSSVPKEKDIKEDIIKASSSTPNLLSKGEKITDFEIKDRETDKKQKYDHAICEVVTEKENVSYTKEVEVTYYKYDKGWSLSDISVNDSKEWTIAPTKGVNKKQIIASLVSRDVKTDGGAWTIEDGEISDVTIKQQDTDIAKGTDKVTVKVNLKGMVESATGIVKAEYTFDKEWKLKNIENQNDFKVKDDPNKALKIDETGLIQALAGKVITVGEQKNDLGGGFYIIDNSMKQEIEINPDEISEFSINREEKYDKGTEYTYECSCKLTKADVKYTLQIKYYYDYGNEWKEPTIDITPVVNAEDINLSGKWIGTYNGAGDDGSVELNITSDDGKNYSGTYSYTPNESYGHAGSYNVSGTFGDTMQLTLTAGDWISKPDKPLSIEKQDVTVRYYIDDSKLKGTGQSGYPFEVSKE